MIWNAFPVTEQIRIDRFYSFFEMHYRKGYDYIGESHNFWECVYVMEGRLWASADERIYNLTEGQIIFHKPLEFHKIYVDSEEGATILIFSYSMEGPFSDFFKNKVFQLSDSQKQILYTMLEYGRSNKEFQKVIAEHRNRRLSRFTQYLAGFKDDTVYSQVLTLYVCQLILSMAEHGQASSASVSPEALLFGQAINYMNQRVCAQPTVAEIANACNVSESTLKRIFHKFSGLSLHKYYLKLKIQAATELLSQGLQVSQVSEKLGFSSQAYFSSCYKRETGRNPSEVLATVLKIQSPKT